MPSRLDGVLLGYLPTEGTLELKHISTSAVSRFTFAPDLCRSTRKDPKRFIRLIGHIVRLYISDDNDLQVDYLEEVKSREDWLNNLKVGDEVVFIRNNERPRELLIRVIDEGHICMVEADNPKSDLALGEVVWLDHGEGPFGERIEPLTLSKEDYRTR